MSLKRLLQPSVTENEKYVNYDIPFMSKEKAKGILTDSFIDGVFGIEAFRVATRESFTFFAPPQYKTDWNKAKSYLEGHVDLGKKNENVTFAQLITTKSSVFPVEMDGVESFWNTISSLCPTHIDIMYQLTLVYRQDNWKEKLQEQYEDYLNGVEQPANNGLFRKIQRGVTGSIDNFLKWENKHSRIEELEKKLRENGFRCNLRFALVGGNKKERGILIRKIEDKINDFAYTNKWIICTDLAFANISENFKKRKLDNLSKHCILSTSEILPFIMTDRTLLIDEVKSTSVQEVNHNLIENDMSISNLLKLLPLGSGLKEIDGKQIAEKFIAALREIKNFHGELVTKRSQSGSLLLTLSFDLPKELKFSEINKTTVINDIQMRMGVKHLQIKQGKDEGEFDVLLPLESRQKVFLRDYIDTNEFIEYAQKNPLAFLVGVDEIGKAIYACLNKNKHLLVAGTTGSGKSVWLNQLILTLLMTKNPSELQFYMIDIKQVELMVFEKFPHVQSVVTDANKAITLLNQLIEEMKRRYELFKNCDVRNIAIYNKKSKDKLPYIVCVIDEYAELSGRNSDVHECVQSLTQLSRAAGIHLVIATQRPSVDVVPAIIKSNLPSKIGFFCSNTRTYMTFLNTKPPYDLLGGGDGTMCFEGQADEHVRFQGCLIVDDPNDDGLEVKLIKRIATKITGERIAMELPLVEEVKEVSELDTLKRLIATTGETRVSQLRNMMKINMNKLNDLMKELVAENWLEQPKTKQAGYSLIVNDEELEKWRK